MKLCQKILVVALALMMLCSAATAELLAGTSSLTIQKAEQVNNQLDIQLYMDTTKPIEETTLSVFADDTQIRWDTIQPLTQTDLPTTWVVLVDNSTIGLQDADKALLKGLVNTAILPKDNVVYLVPDDALESLQVLEQKDLYLNWLDGVKYNDDSKNSLVTGIETALNFLTSGNENVHERKCLVIMSNVKKRSDRNRSFTELEQQVKASGATVYTIITNVDSEPDTKTQSDYLAFETLAAYSTCGKSMRTVERDTAVVDNYLQVFQKNEGCFYKVKADLSNQKVKGSSLKVTLQDGTFVISDVYAIEIGGGGTGGDIVKTFNIEDYMTYIIIGGGVLLAGLIVLLLMPKKKKEEPFDPQLLDNGDDDDVVPPPSTEGPQQVEEYQPTRPDGLRVNLTVLNGKGKPGSAMVEDTIIVGRAFDAGICVGEEDGYISNHHVELMYHNGALYAKNLSRNDTFINGQKITDSVQVEPNDVMRIGHTDYAVTWSL